MKRHLGWIALFFAFFALPVWAGDVVEKREEMVRRQIADRGVKDPAVLKAMRSVPRHLFVPSHLTSEAYEDHPLPIGFGQTISQPFIVALMTELVKPQSRHKVLEIGTGSGYQAAVLAEVVQKVLTVEIIPELGIAARQRLKEMGYKNVFVRLADGYNGWPEEAPFDAIIVTAAADHIPPPLIAQLKDGGKMVIPVGNPFLVQNLVLVEKRQDKVTTQNILPVRFVPLTRGK